MASIITRLYQEGDYWRWSIKHNGREYVDGGNYLTREEAEEGLRAAKEEV